MNATQQIADELREAVEKACRGIQATTTAAANAFRDLASSLARAGMAARSALANAWYSLAAQAYLAHHRRLPGTDRTNRGRKKRATKVLAWFAGHVQKSVAAA